MTDRETIVEISRLCALALNAAPPVTTTPVSTPYVPSVAPPASGKPAPVATMSGADLTGTMGNAAHGVVYGIPAGGLVRWHYNGSGNKQFTSGGLSTDGMPPAVWVWLEGTRGPITTPVRNNGQGTASVTALISGDVWYCEQIEAEGGSVWNRYAQVNDGSVLGPGRGA